jgi:hypothetical protein
MKSDPVMASTGPDLEEVAMMILKKWNG